jgi:hypothetical protein
VDGRLSNYQSTSKATGIGNVKNAIILISPTELNAIVANCRKIKCGIKRRFFVGSLISFRMEETQARKGVDRNTFQTQMIGSVFCAVISILLEGIGVTAAKRKKTSV